MSGREKSDADSIHENPRKSEKENRNGAAGVEQKPAQENGAEQAEIWRAARCAAISECGGWTPLFQRDLRKLLKARKEI